MTIVKNMTMRTVGHTGEELRELTVVGANRQRRRLVKEQSFELRVKLMRGQGQ